MMWPRKRKRGEDESRQALSEARKSLERIKKRTPEVKAVTSAQRNLLERNQFVERLEVIMGGH